jgi:hypothetical protein
MMMIKGMLDVNPNCKLIGCILIPIIVENEYCNHAHQLWDFPCPTILIQVINEEVKLGDKKKMNK